jgi:uncharacterized low-complexity protein
MRISSLLSASLAVLALSCLSATNADDRNYPTIGRANRGLFGMPNSQQWNGARPMTTGYGYNQGNCPNGNCLTGACANGQCATGNCPNGQCGTGYGARQGSASCPNGNCGVNGMTGRVPRPSLYSAQNDWAPRTTRGLADPYRRTGSTNGDAGWTQRTMRPVFEPVTDTFRSRYNEEEMDLNSDYFRGRKELDRDSNDRYNGNRYNSQRSNSDRYMNDRVRPSSRDWDAPSDRSLEAPAPATRSTRI